ncbi:hypothetical protein CCUS01_11267 [Colletotrichum cuscutae]|uniref:Uncharacterized protein n=1 Tax=Colletotrichum cuscutae TaxID=1209917 RepID=A0AAI9XI81_9PEZI|nr:hypothetical protein CCUS01_11267 [Colletotrichum cuscutae]
MSSSLLTSLSLALLSQPIGRSSVTCPNGTILPL